MGVALRSGCRSRYTVILVDDLDCVVRVANEVPFQRGRIPYSRLIRLEHEPKTRMVVYGAVANQFLLEVGRGLADSGGVLMGRLRVLILTRHVGKLIPLARAGSFAGYDVWCQIGVHRASD